VQELCGPTQGASLNILYIWSLNLYQFTCTIFILVTLLCVLGSYELQNPEVLSIPAVLVKFGSFEFANSEVPGLADSKFNPLYLSENL